MPCSLTLRRKGGTAKSYRNMSQVKKNQGTARLIPLILLLALNMMIGTAINGDRNQQAVITAPSRQQPNSARELAPSSSTPVVLWNYTTNGIISSSPVVADLLGNGKQEVVVAPYANNVYCLNGTTGDQIWVHFIMSGAIYLSPVVADLLGDGKQEVIVAASGNVSCLNGASGDQLWNFPTGDQINSPLVIANLLGDGKREILAASYSHRVYCLNGTGNQLWNYTTGAKILSSPVAADLLGNGNPEVLVASNDSIVYCLNGTTGSKLWNYTTEAGLWCSPVVADLLGDSGKEVLVGSKDHRVYCLNGSTGIQLWNYTTKGEVDKSPAVANVLGDGKYEVLVASNLCCVYCLNGTTGSQLWNYTTEDIFDSSPLVTDLLGNGEKEILAETTGCIYCLSGTGSQLWSFAPGGMLYAPPTVADLLGEGMQEVLVTSWNDNVYCLNATGDLLWSYQTGDSIHSSAVVADLLGIGEKQVLVTSFDSKAYCLLVPDTVQPTPITNLAVGSSTTTSLTLTWTAPGDNGVSGNATGYVVKYLTSGPITSSNWASASTYKQTWIPLATGQTETRIASDLSNATRYWFAVEAYDDASPPNYCAVSNSPSGLTLDAFPPATIGNLATSSPTATSITLSWTAPGDNGTRGTASGYVVKYSASGPITTSNWASVSNYTQSWTPQRGGLSESHVVSGLGNATRYWFAVAAYDAASPCNFGSVSNSPSRLTLDAFPPATTIDLVAGNSTATGVTLTWTAPGNNGTLGTAMGYVVRYSTSSSINASNWDSATTYLQYWSPLAAGQTETHVISGLESSTEYWFAVETYDDASPHNYSGVSVSPNATTTAQSGGDGGDGTGGGSGDGGGELSIAIIIGVFVAATVVILAAVTYAKRRNRLRSKKATIS